jgi:NUMOD3 motif-containing protein/GIY-YIG catalytic domain-containing protein
MVGELIIKQSTPKVLLTPRAFWQRPVKEAAAMNTFIYVLVDPSSQQVRYIGKSNHPVRRLQEHLACKTSNLHLTRWIKKLSAQGAQPSLSILEETPEECWQERECYWIAHFRALGAPLVNLDGGGIGGHTISEETRLKLSVANKGNKNMLGRKHSELTLLKLRTVRAGQPGPVPKGSRQSPEHVANKAAALRGQKRSAEQNDKNRLAQLGKTMSEDIRKKISAALTGKAKSPETVAKAKAARAGWKPDPELCKIWAERRKGFKHTPETRQKIAEASKRHAQGRYEQEHHTIICPTCGKARELTNSRPRIYCRRACYLEARKKACEKSSLSASSTTI